MTRVNLVSRIAVSLVVGMLATIGISWSLVILMPRGSDTWSIEPDSEGNDGPLAWPVPVPDDWPGCQSVQEFHAPGRALLECVTRLEIIGHGSCFVTVDRTGWPMLAMQTHVKGSTVWPGEVHEQTGLAVGVGDAVVSLPLRAMPLGFAVNSMIVAGPFFAAMRWAARSPRRERIGTCPECGGGKAKPFILRLGLGSLFLGTIATVATSWILVVRVDPRPVGRALGTPGMETGPWNQVLFGDDRFRPWELVPPSDWPTDAVCVGTLEWPTTKPGMMARRAFAGTWNTTAAPLSREVEWDGSGWPLLAMQSRRMLGGGLEVPAASFDSGIRAREWGSAPAGARPPSAAYLPLRPIPFGFGFNSLFFAAAVFVPVGAFVQMRRVLRRRACRCERCGYSLEGLRENAA
jgi:hypothetical protein